MNLANNELYELIENAQKASPSLDKHTVIQLLDLTSLNEDDDENTITKLCERANTSKGNIAAICIYPKFVKTAHELLQKQPIQLATVANFPEGNHHLTPTLNTIKNAIKEGATEIDVVMPYQAYLAGNSTLAARFILACKEVCGSKVLLKVIIESGAFNNPKMIYHACRLVIQNGADFVKTSTGKIAIGATLEAAAYMLLAIKNSGRAVGFKASGGVKTEQDTAGYLYLAEKIMGKEFIDQNTFRFGASSLLDSLLK